MSLQSLALDAYAETGRAPPTRLEQLVAMDPDRWRELQTARPPGTGLREAVRHMNRAYWARTAPRVRAAGVACDFGVHTRVPVATYRWALRMVRGCLAWPQAAAARRRLAASIAAGDTARIARDLAAARAAAACAWDALLQLGVDLVLGALLAHALREHEAWLVRAAARLVEAVRAPALRSVLDWLAHWPLGIKLNTELALFLRDVLASLAEVDTRYVLTPLGAWIAPYVGACLAVGRVLGVSLVLSVQLDVLAVLGVHLRVMHAVLRPVYVFFARAAGSLFDMFRGKTRNPLHHGRLDAAHYEVDQLFLGTILFTLLLFLFPTVALFYATCAAAHGAVVCMRAALAAAVGVLGALPLYTLLVRRVDPARVPAGVVLRPRGAGVYAVESAAAAHGAAWAGVRRALRPLVGVPALVWAAVRGRPLEVPLYPI